MKKKLDTTTITNELRGQSAFFPRDTQEPDAPASLPESPSVPSRGNTNELHPTRASELASKHASTLAENDVIQGIVKTLRSLGKEVIYVRSTVEEKAQIRDIVYTYARQGMKTSDNEIGRIAINYLLEDYKTHGENSILAKALQELHT